MWRFLLFFSKAIKTCKILYLAVIIKVVCLFVFVSRLIRNIKRELNELIQFCLSNIYIYIKLYIIIIKLPAFYEECSKSFAKCSEVNNLNIQDLNGKDLSKVILWNNKFICVGDKSVYFRNLAEKGIFRVGDLISNKHELIIKSELRVLNLSPLDAFRLVSLIDALPTQWRESLKSCISTGDTPFILRDEIKLRLKCQIVLLETNTKVGTDGQTWRRLKRIAIEVMENLLA